MSNMINVGVSEVNNVNMIDDTPTPKSVEKISFLQFCVVWLTQLCGKGNRTKCSRAKPNPGSLPAVGL